MFMTHLNVLINILLAKGDSLKTFTKGKFKQRLSTITPNINKNKQLLFISNYWNTKRDHDISHGNLYPDLGQSSTTTI
jgi:hypothetical protein